MPQNPDAYLLTQRAVDQLRRDHQQLQSQLQSVNDQVARAMAALHAQTPPPKQLLVKNNFAGEIPPGACLKIVERAQYAGQSGAAVNQPDSSPGVYVFNGARRIAQGGYGLADTYGHCLARFSGSAPAALAEVGPVPGAWHLATGSTTTIARVIGGDPRTPGEMLVLLYPAPPQPGAVRLVKTTTNHGANATADVHVWRGTPTSETLSTGPIVLSATNKSTSSIPTDTFCLATLVNMADAGDPVDLKWYLIPLNGGTGGCRLFIGNLSGSLTSGAATIGLTGVIAYDNGSTPGTLTANNVLKLAAPNSALGIVVLKVATGQYDLVNVLHVTRTVINDIGWDGTTLNVDLKTLVTMDDNSDTLDVEVFTVIETDMVNDVALYGYNLRQTKAPYKVFAKGTDATSVVFLGTDCPVTSGAPTIQSTGGYDYQSMGSASSYY